MEDPMDNWVDIGEILPDLGTAPFFVAHDRRDEVVDQLCQAGFDIVEVGMAGLLDDEEFAARFGWAAGAPSYFGENWDALDEVLRDRGSEEPWSIALIVTGGRSFASRNLHDYVRTVAILYAMSEYMSDIDAYFGQLVILYIED